MTDPDGATARGASPFPNALRAGYCLVLALTVIWALAATFLPVTQDEAYYFAWASHFDLGYFDHPPLVALIGQTSRFARGIPLLARAGTVLCGVMTAFALLRLAKGLGLGAKGQAAALTLGLFNVMGLAVGVLTTPDAPLMLLWTLALSEAAWALRDPGPGGGGDPRRWLFAGLLTGLGLNAKYTMLLMGPVFLWALFRATRRGGVAESYGAGLRSPWPYLGGLAALLVWSPHLWWNAQHDWITLRFQARHGFSMERPEDSRTALPRPLPEDPNGAEALIAGSFEALQDAEEAEDYRDRPWDAVMKRVNRHVGWYGSQLAFWGAFLGGAVSVWLRRRRRRAAGEYGSLAHSDGEIRPELRPLMFAAVAVPLGVFALLTLVTKVEANWSAMYLVAAAPLLAPWALRAPRTTAVCAGVNVLVAALAVTHARTGLLPSKRPHRDRLLVETHGYEAVATLASELPGPVFADSYQLTAMTRFYRPAVATRQWPGITRDSEFIRNGAFADLTLPDLEHYGAFWLITTDPVPPRLPGFLAEDLSQLRDCQGEGLQVINARAAPDAAPGRCKPPIHEWYLVRYGRSKDNS